MSHEAPDMAIWSGRAKGGPDETLIHHLIQPLHLDELPEAKPKSIAFLGFCSDEGVRRNLGRPGAIDGPNAIRMALCNLAVHWQEDSINLFDAGNVLCLNHDLETAQKILKEKVEQLHAKGYFPLLLGGGHEISYPHFSGMNDESNTVGMINLDAHFDLRGYEKGAHSGSWVRQLMDDQDKRGKTFQYLPIGINPAVNNRQMFGVMQTAGQDVILLEELKNGLTPEIESRIKAFLDRCDKICLTLDLDVISGGHAPGVSAPAPFGLSPELTWDLIKLILKSEKVQSMDIAELNPEFDDGRTSKLAAQIIWRVLNLLTSNS